MGRYLANGVLTQFSVKRVKRSFYDENYNLEKELDNVLKEMNKMIDTSNYELTAKEKDYYVFSLKSTFFEENIHELIKETSKMTLPNVNDFYTNGFNEKLVESENFAKQFPFKAKIDKNGEYSIKMRDEEIRLDFPFDPFYWMIREDILLRNIMVRGETLLLWCDDSKYVGEDETAMLEIINTMKRKYYKSKLSKSLIYYISG